MGQEKKVDVTIYAEPDKSGSGISFSLESVLGNGDRLTFKNDKKDDFYKVFYHLEDGNLGLKFRSDPDDALWVVKGGPCPRSPAKDDEFKPIQVTDQDKTLVVHNKNRVEAEYVYTLRFVQADGTGVDWDPIIDNRNGGTAIVRFSLMGCVAAAGGAVALLLGALGLRKLIGADKEDDGR